MYQNIKQFKILSVFLIVFMCSLFSCKDKTDNAINAGAVNNEMVLESQKRSFSQEETDLQKKLFDLRKEVKKGLGKPLSAFYRKPFQEARKIMDTTLLLDIFQVMPKGGLLHTHSGGVTDVNWIINKVKNDQDVYVFVDSDNDKYLYGELTFFEENKVPKGFVRLKNHIVTHPNFAKDLYSLLILEDNLSDPIDHWVEFEKRFKRIGKIISYRPFFKEYYRKAFTDLLKDKIQHIEIRFIFEHLYDFNTKAYPFEIIVEDLKDVLIEIQEKDPDFSLSLIYTSFKFLDKESIDEHLYRAFELKKKYPEIISGFDLVAEEARGNSISYYNESWKKKDSLEKLFNLELPLYLHAGESNSIENKNLFDVISLDNKRIGHGLNSVLFPEIINQIKEKDMLVELNPWSNKILGYTNDMRNHPGRILLSNGVSCSISNDDPGVFGYNGLAYDFWIIFMAWELDLKAIKNLVFNSIEYASLTKENKKNSLKELIKRWDLFVSDTNKILSKS